MVSIIIGGVIGVTEEISIKQVLWHHISCNMVLVWHIAPQSVLPNQMPGGMPHFFFYALLLGLDWGLVAWRTDSIKWVIAGHCIHDSLGLSGFAFLQSNGTLQISFFCKGLALSFIGYYQQLAEEWSLINYNFIVSFGLTTIHTHIHSFNVS